MSGPRGIELALDLARMPVLAQSIDKPPLPTDIFEVMRIAAASPEVCQSAAQATGQPVAVLIEAARFYLQQILLRADADPYRVLGLPPGASRELARRHLQCLLQWLHPDVNKDLDSVYTDRVLKAWREVSASIDSARASNSRAHGLAERKARMPVGPKLRMPWIDKTQKKMHQTGNVPLPLAKRIGIGVGVAAAALLLAAVIALYAVQAG
jgi:hypothetical protein